MVYWDMEVRVLEVYQRQPIVLPEGESDRRWCLYFEWVIVVYHPVSAIGGSMRR